MKRAFLFFAFAILLCNITLAQEPDPDPNLLWVTEQGYIRFLVHPNGNILAGKHSTEVELDGNTGEIIREFPYQVIIYDVSPDGKYISALTDQRCVIDYETLEVIDRFTNENTFPKFMPDNKTLVYFVIEKIGELKGNLKLRSYNIETKRYLTSSQQVSNTTSGAISVSPDGRFVATGGRYFDASDNEYTRLILWDAQTLEPIKVLGEFEYFNSVNSIKFSPDSRLVGFGVDPKRVYIYNTMDFSLRKKFDAYSFCFITNSIIAYGDVIDFWTQNYFLKIEDFELNKIIYRNDNLSAEAMEFIIQKQLWLIKFRAQIYAFDYMKIISGIEDSFENITPYSLVYESNTLSIRNFIFNSLRLTGQILDINGKLIRHIELNTSTGEIRIPIKLISGTYFLHIKDGGMEYVAKFWVVE
ncbi:MAG: hypothetical protein CVV22_10925 [Ignavibacteriae bacterium HGW-Ignavibacteriae-1]|jgi:WD40 repeat protein|nr:MAG: hypothetical protein CVV22_10925 [Ignavibacteriae bacterium HGW-Ignavibacteriae-1]